MINGMFWFFMNCIGNILKTVIVFGILGFILMLPFLLKGGWLLGILIYGYIGIAVVVFLSNQNSNIQNNFENNIKEKKENDNK